MKLPHGERAMVEIAKIADYCLNPEHPRGRHKARMFSAALALGRQDAFWLRGELLAAARERDDAVAGEADQFGQRYVLDFPVRREAREAVIRSAWIIRTGDDRPRLVTCYVL